MVQRLRHRARRSLDAFSRRNNPYGRTAGRKTRKYCHQTAMNKLLALMVAAGISQRIAPEAFAADPGASSVFRGGAAIDAVLASAVRADQIPGAVVLVGHE